MRVFVLLFVLLSLAAACGGGSTHSIATPSPTRLPAATPTPAPTTQAVIPFTPVEEVLTPPPDIDTSGWLTYLDTEHRFELKYPRDAQIKRDLKRTGLGPSGTGTEIDLTFARGTTLGAKYVFITVAGIAPDACLPRQLTQAPKPGSTPAVQYLRTADAGFWKTREPGGYMHQWFDAAVFMTSGVGGCVTINGVLEGFSSTSATSPPPPDASESDVFAAILSTFRWLDQP
jgi:hypothetical protein